MPVLEIPVCVRGNIVFIKHEDNNYVATCERGINTDNMVVVEHNGEYFIFILDFKTKTCQETITLAFVGSREVVTIAPNIFDEYELNHEALSRMGDAFVAQKIEDRLKLFHPDGRHFTTLTRRGDQCDSILNPIIQSITVMLNSATLSANQIDALEGARELLMQSNL